LAVAAALATAAAVSAAARPAPSLEGFDIRTGRHVSLADYAGKRVVVNTWGSWCRDCVQEAPDLKRFAAMHPEVQMLGIDVHDTKAGARYFYAHHDEDWPSIFDPTGTIAQRFGADGAPVTFFLDRRHRIVVVAYGAQRLSVLNALYRKTLR